MCYRQSESVPPPAVHLREPPDLCADHDLYQCKVTNARNARCAACNRGGGNQAVLSETLGLRMLRNVTEGRKIMCRVTLGKATSNLRRTRQMPSKIRRLIKFFNERERLIIATLLYRQRRQRAISMLKNYSGNHISLLYENHRISLADRHGKRTICSEFHVTMKLDYLMMTLGCMNVERELVQMSQSPPTGVWDGAERRSCADRRVNSISIEPNRRRNSGRRLLDTYVSNQPYQLSAP